ncbi:L2 [Rousettus aegyptiacus papillomavirus 1]|uniref:Minor capsid protein L2 n=1 Tax=Rousettus aegyptiacus papillomavirus 1 TaxID=369584 RepID=Q0QIH6_9PAPI|nr:L2 [Rousettus aegyptiacus papillomavirus 1]ABC95029.1 L2 [Rousettus aegyptiacus papillomavirus 1]
MAPRKRRATRVPRDSATNLYRQPGCRVDGNCPWGVKEQIENKTPADRILQYGSAVINLGGLGIGTGAGSGGRGGYIPMGADRGIGVGAWPRPAYPARPVVPAIETVGPTISIPEVVATDVIEMEPIVTAVDPSVIDTHPPIDPTDPAIVEDFGSYPPRPAIIDESVPTQGGNRIQVVAEVHHPADLFPSTTISSGGSTTSAVLEVGEQIPLMPRSNPPHIHEPSLLTTTTSFGTNADVVGSRASIIDFDAVDEAVGDDIPLLDRTYDRNANLEFRTSTPQSGRRPNPVKALKSLYNKYVRQVPVEDPLFMEAPGHLIEFGNPVFQPEESLEYPLQDNPLASPDERLQGTHRLHRPILSEVPGGRGIRLSRLGAIGAMRMRSGLTVGPRVHVYHDISSIEEAIELQPLGVEPHSVTGEAVMQDTSVDALTEEDITEQGFEDVPLLSPHAGQQVRLQVGPGGRNNRNVVSLEIPTTNRADTFGINIGEASDIYVHYADEKHTIPGFVPGIPLGPAVPPVIVEDDTAAYDYWFDLYLHLPRKKRKWCSFCSLTDGIVDT